MTMIITFDFLFRILTIFLILAREFYWIITERIANQEKPKTTGKPIKLYQRPRRLVFPIIQIILFLQLLGWQVFPFGEQVFIVQLIGFVLALSGVGIAISARRELGLNWAPGAEYQIKKKQELVTTGIYKYVRHPIYLSGFLSITGAELVTQSYLALIGFMLLIRGYWQGRLEEKLLISHFGNSYKTYMKRTKMFLPFLW